MIGNINAGLFGIPIPPVTTFDVDFFVVDDHAVLRQGVRCVS